MTYQNLSILKKKVGFSILFAYRSRMNSMLSISAKVHKYVKERSQKYCNSEKITERLEILKEHASKRPHILYVIVFDEAHYSATSKTVKEQRKTPYSKLAESWNSREYPNVVVLLVSATPWNLQTINTRINRLSEIKIDPNNDYEIRAVDDQSGDRYKRSKTLLHEVQWNHHMESELRNGKQCRLLVSAGIR